MMDKDPSTHCSLCGQDIWEMADRGAYLKRVSPKGGPFIGECSPSCETKTGGQAEALLAALSDGDSFKEG